MEFLNMSDFLENKTELISKIMAHNISTDLMGQIEHYWCRHFKDDLYSGLVFRANLHYILDNIDKPGLAEKLRKLMSNEFKMPK
jgi:hypothetical protein